MDDLIGKKIAIEDMMLFEMLSSTGSISGVAHQTGLTQPAITQKLNRLEKQIGFSLWIRRGRSLGEPSEVGKRFLNYSKVVLRETMDLFTDLGIMTRDRIIHVGTSSIPSEHFVPRLITMYRGKNGCEEMRLSLAGSRKLCLLVENGDIDAGFTGYIVPGYSGKSHIIASDTIVPVISSNSAIARKNKEVRFEDLKDLPLILRESESGTRSILEETFTKYGFDLPVRKNSIEVGGTHCLVQAVHEGLGFSFVSSLHCKNLHIMKIKDLPEIHRNFYLIYRSDSLLERKIDNFIQFVLDYPSTNLKAENKNV
ncbi:LysR family transcriptional regulator [bacterium]|nr:LysR family transcriptional regulator [bacterium]